MPYEISRSGCPKGKPYAVRKVGGGDVVGCHASEASASRQIRALYANEKQNSRVDEEIVQEVAAPTAENVEPVTDEMMAVIREVAAQYHPHLDLDSIAFFSRAIAPEESTGYLYGQVDVDNADFPGFDFVIWFSRDIWDALNDHQRHAIVDHEFYHCGYTDSGEPFLISHDIEEWNDVLARYGVWWPQNEETVAAIQSLNYIEKESNVGESAKYTGSKVNAAAMNDDPAYSWLCPHLSARPKTKARVGALAANGSSGSTGAGTHGSTGANGSSGSTGAGYTSRGGGTHGSTGANGSSGSTGANGSSGSTGAGQSGSTGVAEGTHPDTDHFSVQIGEDEWIALCPECFAMAARSILEDLLGGI